MLTGEFSVNMFIFCDFLPSLSSLLFHISNISCVTLMDLGPASVETYSSLPWGMSSTFFQYDGYWAGGASEATEASWVCPVYQPLHWKLEELSLSLSHIHKPVTASDCSSMCCRMLIHVIITWDGMIYTACAGDKCSNNCRWSCGYHALHGSQRGKTETCRQREIVENTMRNNRGFIKGCVWTVHCGFFPILCPGSV